MDKVKRGPRSAEKAALPVELTHTSLTGAITVGGRHSKKKRKIAKSLTWLAKAAKKVRRRKSYVEGEAPDPDPMNPLVRI